VFGFVYSYSVYINIFTNTKLANKGTNNAKTLALLVFIKPAARLLVRMRASRALLVSSFVDHPGTFCSSTLSNLISNLFFLGPSRPFNKRFRKLYVARFGKPPKNGYYSGWLNAY